MTDDHQRTEGGGVRETRARAGLERNGRGDPVCRGGVGAAGGVTKQMTGNRSDHRARVDACDPACLFLEVYWYFRYRGHHEQ